MIRAKTQYSKELICDLMYKVSLKKVVSSKKNERFIDVAWPIFDGKAGILRLGISERPYQRQVNQLWIQIQVEQRGPAIS